MAVETLLNSVAVSRDTAHAVALGDGPELVARATQPHFMLVPSLACPAACSYCFGPHQGPTISPETMECSLDFIVRIAQETGQRKAKVTFHGGEPLAAGHAIWRQALEGLRARLGPRGYQVDVQSNLWLLDDGFCELFREHQVEIGTSLDGPQGITDQQRGAGYFERTIRGVRLAEAYGLKVGCIATFTPGSAVRWREIFDFFLGQRLGFSIHAAVPPLAVQDGRHAISPEQYGRLLCEMLDYYVEHRRDIAVSSLDQMCQGVGCGEGKVCSFRDCLGMFLAIDPSGDIYPCQRLCGRPAFRLGHLADNPDIEELLDSSTGRRMRQRQERVNDACGSCPHVNYCRGGCPYNAWASGDDQQVRDPYCLAYRATFDHIRDRLLAEMASERNIEAVAARPYDGRGHPLLRDGPLIELTRPGPHPSQIARTAKRIVAAVELARGPDIEAVAKRLVEVGICRGLDSALVSLAGLQRRLDPPSGRLNNLYLHVTFRCQLECMHCYARSDSHGHQQSDMPVTDLARLVREAKTVGFRQVVITGGEPLIHHHRRELLEELARLRSWASPMNLVLRTNLAMPLAWEDLRQIALAFDQVVVSVDGSQATHDARRGRGSHTAALQNLEAYGNVTGGVRDAGELSLACVMGARDIQGEPGRAVKELANRLGVRRTRFRPLLPLGRAQDWPEPPLSEALGAHCDPQELIEDGFCPVATCGLGQNLYVEPCGESFPCYAYHRRHSLLGNVLAGPEALATVLASLAFRDLSSHTVDTNPKCRTCDVRYLCGGACRAWGGERTQGNLDAPCPDCAGLIARATALDAAARRHLAANMSADLSSDDERGKPC